MSDGKAVPLGGGKKSVPGENVGLTSGPGWRNQPPAPSPERPKPGYHKSPIPKGELGEFSKIEEEFMELKDAHNQDAKLLMLCELSDLYGAIKHYLHKHHPNVTMEDVAKFSKQTEDAFRSGLRK